MSESDGKQLFLSMIVLLLVFLISTETFAAGEGGHGHRHGKSEHIGRPGEKLEATKIIKIAMFDNYFQPKFLQLNEGETVQFIVKNHGEFVHEFNIATKDMHKSHGPEMLMMVEHGVIEADKINWDAAKSMQKKVGHGLHNEPNSVLLEPGETGKIVWTFPTHAALEFACNVPGHYESGMVGKIKLTH